MSKDEKTKIGTFNAPGGVAINTPETNRKIKEIDKVVIGFDNLKQMRDLVKINKKHVSNFPNLECKDKMLLNPYNWNNL